MIDFKLFGGFDNGQMDKRMDICTSRVAFATENLVWGEVVTSYMEALHK